MESPRAEPRPPNLEAEPTLFLVYTVHLDSQWRWTIQDTIREFIPATLEGNFELFEAHPERVLSFEGAFRYRLIEEYYPRDFERLREAVAKGNWRPAGMMLDSPDVNCVAPESLLRHVLYAKGYFEKSLGRGSLDFFLPDCFGFGHALPSIAAHCGIQGFSAQKFGKWGAPAEIPFHVGRWLGPDGEGVIAAIRPEGYGEGLQEDLSHAERWQRRIERQFEESGLKVAFMYVGLGDRGGRLGEGSLEWIDRSVHGSGPIRVIQAASDTLFTEISSSQAEGLPTYQGELLLPTHGTGCWTSQAAAKRWNRACERTADQAERAAVLADWLGVMAYPADQLREAWWRFLWHQMHDDLTGTSIPEAYRFTWNDQLVSLNQFETVLDDAIEAVGTCLDTSGPGIPLLVFNPLERERCDVIEVEVDWPDAPTLIAARGPDGELTPVQIVSKRGDSLRLIFAPKLRPMGMSVWLMLAAGEMDHVKGVEAAVDVLANEHYRLALNVHGEIASIIDRKAGTELLAAPLRLELVPDLSNRWPAWEIRHRDVRAEPKPLRGTPEITLVENGPVRAVIEVRRRFAGSTYRQRIALAAGDAGSRIEIDLDVDWRTRGKLLKAALRQKAATPEAVYGLGCGTIRRGVNSPAKYEVPGLWAAPGSGGLALIAEGQAGWDRPDEATLRLSLLRSPRVLRKFRHQGRQDHGRHRLRFALAVQASVEGTEEQSRRLVARPRATVAKRPGEGTQGRSVSLLRVDSRAVVRALKKPEEGAGLVLRLQESGGRERRGLAVSAANRIRSVTQLSGSEDEMRTPEPVAISSEGELQLDLTPYSLRTLRLEIEPPAAQCLVPRRQSLEIPYDWRATSEQGETFTDDSGGRDRLPAELWPSGLRAGAVPFVLGPAGDKNALACRGQQLTWPQSCRHLYLLAAAVDRPRREIFRLGGREIELDIDHGRGIIGRFKGWRRGLKHLQWTRPGGGFVRRHRIAWVATHLHDSTGEDVAYEYGYLFRYRFDLEPGDRALTLPEAPRITLFAATVENRATPY